VIAQAFLACIAKWNYKEQVLSFSERWNLLFVVQLCLHDAPSMQRNASIRRVKTERLICRLRCSL
jgi:hypothetical protein